MSNKIVAALVAGAVLVGAGLATALVSSPAPASAQGSENGDDDAVKLRHGALLESVLDELVEAGTIDESQKEAILGALAEKFEELRQEHPRLGHRLHRGLRSLLDDGGIDAEEYESLPDDHPLKRLDAEELLDDGVITLDELRELFRSSRATS